MIQRREDAEKLAQELRYLRLAVEDIDPKVAKGVIVTALLLAHRAQEAGRMGVRPFMNIVLEPPATEPEREFKGFQQHSH